MEGAPHVPTEWRWVGFSAFLAQVTLRHFPVAKGGVTAALARALQLHEHEDDEADTDKYRLRKAMSA